PQPQVQPQLPPPRREPVQCNERIAEMNRRRNESPSKTIARQRIAEYFKQYCSEGRFG
ncbi:4371_t:CDS:1, partial [Ambispora gerdemannii]